MGVGGALHPQPVTLLDRQPARPCQWTLTYACSARSLRLPQAAQRAGSLLLLGCWLLLAPPAQALQVPVREAEIASCLPGEQAQWPDGRDRAVGAAGLRVSYRHAGAPPWFSATQVLAVVQRAAVAWAACGVPVQLQVQASQPGAAGQDASAQAEAAPSTATAVGQVLVQWNEPGSAGNFGLAHLGQRTLSLGRGAFELLRQRNPAYPAADVLQMVVSHELGHFFGLMAHSRRCVDVMSYYHDAQGRQCFTRDGQDHRLVPEYRALLPTACDIQRCRAVNGLPLAP